MSEKTRYTQIDLDVVVSQWKTRLNKLEAENAALREELDKAKTGERMYRELAVEYEKQIPALRAAGEGLAEAGEKKLRFGDSDRKPYHHIWCNYPSDEGNGNKRCNCGTADMIEAIKHFREVAGE